MRGVGYSFLSERSRSMQSRTIETFSFQVLKSVPLSMEIELMLLILVWVDEVTELTTKKNNLLTIQNYVKAFKNNQNNGGGGPISK